MWRWKAKRNEKQNVVTNQYFRLLAVATDGIARSRRETAGGCNINHNTNRQLLVGCSEESVIEVKPKCKIDDEECK